MLATQIENELRKYVQIVNIISNNFEVILCVLSIGKFQKSSALSIMWYTVTARARSCTILAVPMFVILLVDLVRVGSLFSRRGAIHAWYVEKKRFRIFHGGLAVFVRLLEM